MSASDLSGTMAELDPKPASPLLALLAELRNRIYEYVASGKFLMRGDSISGETTALADTCRQTRSEYLPMLHDRVQEAVVIDVEVGITEITRLVRLVGVLKELPKGQQRHLDIRITLRDHITVSANLDAWKPWLELCETNERVKAMKRTYIVALVDPAAWVEVEARRVLNELSKGLYEFSNGSAITDGIHLGMSVGYCLSKVANVQSEQTESEVRRGAERAEQRASIGVTVRKGAELFSRPF